MGGWRGLHGWLVRCQFRQLIFGGQGIASGYQAVQNIIPSIQQQRQQQGLLKEVGNIQEKYFPTEQQETRQALNANLGRERLASSPYSLTTSLGLPQENVQPQAMGQPIDFNAALKDVARLSTNPNAAKMLPGITEAFKNLQPTVQAGGLITDPNRYEVQSLLDRRKVGRSIEYKVKWRNYKETTWEKRTQLIKDIPQLIEKYDKKNP